MGKPPSKKAGRPGAVAQFGFQLNLKKAEPNCIEDKGERKVLTRRVSHQLVNSLELEKLEKAH